MKKNHWRQTIAKLGLFSLLTVVPAGAAALFIPIDWYAFRSWEVLVDRRPEPYRAGVFYPNRVLERMEEGDIGHGTPYAVSRKAVWVTDEYGYRNRKSASAGEMDIVLVGKSEANGSSMTQSEIFSEVLERKTGRPVYAYAPELFETFLNDPRFKERMPRAVIFSAGEAALFNGNAVFGAPSIEGRGFMPRRMLLDFYFKTAPESVQIYVDQVFKKPPFLKHVLSRWVRHSSIRFGSDGMRPPVLNEPERMFFYYERIDAARRYWQHPETAERIAEQIKFCFEEVRKRGTDFLFLPVPNKETIYWELVPERYRIGIPRSDFLPRLTAHLKKEGVPVIDFQKALMDEKKRGELLYRLDDSHWNPRAVELAADLAAAKLKK